jgi:hypothetical protein
MSKCLSLPKWSETWRISALDASDVKTEKKGDEHAARRFAGVSVSLLGSFKSEGADGEGAPEAATGRNNREKTQQ